MSAMGPPTSSCCSHRSKAGATSKSPIVTPPWIMLTSRKTWPTSTFPPPRPSFWFRTISTSTARRHSTKPFRPPKPGRLVEQFEWHYTPKHGSWLNLAESELGVLSSQCLDRRIPDKQTLVEEVAAWEQDRNANHAKANWHFTTPKARIKLKHLYPSI